MADFFGLDPSSIINSIGGALASIAPAPAPRAEFAPGQPGQAGFTPAPVVAGDNAWPVITTGGSSGFAPAQMHLGSFAPSAGGYGGFAPSAGGYGGFEPSQGGYGGFQPSALNPLIDPEERKPAGATGGQGGYAGGAVNASGVQSWLQQKRPDSPLVPIAGDIVAYAQARGVDPALIFGQLQAESGFASDTGMGTRQNNPGNIMAPGANPAAGVIILRSYPTMLDGVKAMVDLLAGYNATYGRRFQPQTGQLTLEDMVAIYYFGPEAYAKYGLNANDAGGSGPGGNGTVNDYLNRHVRPVQADFQQFRQAQGGAPYQGGAGGMASIWGGVGSSITQPYGAVTPGIDQGIYGYGAAYGLPQGHTGDDIGIPRGTRLYMPQGLTGTVTTAGGTPYFRDEDYGDGGQPGKGELRITLSNGDILILGHTSAINVQVGQQLSGGDFVGLSGSANGPHVHVEIRQKQPDGTYRLVDPQVYFGG
jgi:murein DD-endopeptidase MepM/ murein hydrolase activator NlpD